MGKYTSKREVVYLDQKDWIFLAKGYYNNQLKANKEICNLVLEASEKKTVFPLSIIHLEETLSRLNPKKREQLATFMIKVSRGYSILPANSIMKSEVRQATLKKLGLPTIDIRKIVIGRGISHMLGAKGELKRKEGAIGPELSEETKRKILDYVDSPQALSRLLTTQELAEQTQQIRQTHTSTVEKMEEIRRRNIAIKDNNLRYRVCIARFLIDVIGPWFVDVVTEYNLPIKPIMEKWTQEEFTEFFQNMPTAYCLFTLTYRRDQYIQRPIAKNDINDIWALTLAIPYCDIVVTESMWAAIACQSKLDKIYNTVILSSAKDLKNHL